MTVAFLAILVLGCLVFFKAVVLNFVLRYTLPV